MLAENDKTMAELMRLSSPNELDSLMRMLPPEHARRRKMTEERARDLGDPEHYQDTPFDDPRYNAERSQPIGAYKGNTYG